MLNQLVVNIAIYLDNQFSPRAKNLRRSDQVDAVVETYILRNDARANVSTTTPLQVSFRDAAL